MHLPGRLLVVVAVAACAGPDGPTSLDPAGSRFTVGGLVYDSLARELGGDWIATGVRVSVNGVVAITDTDGRFTATGVSGASEAEIVFESRDYELLVRSVEIDRDMTVSIGLRRLAPLVTGFRPFGDSTRITVVDLQSRKTVDRWQVTQAVLRNAASEWTQFGAQWAWNPIDGFTWLVSIPNTGAAQSFRFDIHDVTGSADTAFCTVGGGCSHLEIAAGPAL